VQLRGSATLGILDGGGWGVGGVTTGLYYSCRMLRETQWKGSVKEPNKFHIYETEKITRKASDAA